jgi:hypothetical protein
MMNIVFPDLISLLCDESKSKHFFINESGSSLRIVKKKDSYYTFSFSVIVEQSPLLAFINYYKGEFMLNDGFIIQNGLISLIDLYGELSLDSSKTVTDIIQLFFIPEIPTLLQKNLYLCKEK